MDDNLDTALQSVRSTLQILQTDSSFRTSEPLVTKHGVSLLTLKNHSLISYLQNSALVLLSQIERSTMGNEDLASLEKIRNNAVKNTITQRIVLEKGLKGLESKISYQIEKSLRAFAKSKADSSRKSNVGEASDEEYSNEKAFTEDKDDEEANGDLLLYKPNPKLLLGTKIDDKIKISSDKSTVRNSEVNVKPSSEKYQPPKISATTPFGSSSGKRSQHKRKNALMEDYLESTSLTPVAEPSIGSTIIDHGRGGVSTARERRKEKEINDYEETNYTRLSSITRKQQEKEKKKRKGANSDSFFGEDWGFSGSSNVESATTRKKNSSLWDRAKKRRRG